MMPLRRHARAWTKLLVAWAAVGSSASGLQIGLYLDRKPSAGEVKANFSAAKHEPLYGCYQGAFIDLDSSLKETCKDTVGRVRRLPEEFERVTGTTHATYFFYLGYGRPLPKDWVSMLAAQGKIVHIAPAATSTGMDLCRRSFSSPITMRYATAKSARQVKPTQVIVRSGVDMGAYYRVGFGHVAN